MLWYDSRIHHIPLATNDVGILQPCVVEHRFLQMGTPASTWTASHRGPHAIITKGMNANIAGVVKQPHMQDAVRSIVSR